jgi:hypothetical protein
MNLWAQESTKSELWLKRYKSLKLEGLDCKKAGARLEGLFKTEG